MREVSEVSKKDHTVAEMDENKRPSIEEMDEIAISLGFKIAGPDDQIYKQGATIRFSNKMSKEFFISPSDYMKTDYNDVRVSDTEEEDSEIFDLNLVNIPDEKPVLFKYDSVSDFHEGLAVVTQDVKHSVIDKVGNELFELRYDKFAFFSEGLLAVKGNGKWGYIDKTGNEVIPLAYDKVTNFSDGIAAVELNKEWSHINKAGKKVLALKTDTKNGQNDCSSESLTEIERDGKYGFADENGKEVIAPKYDDVGRFYNGLVKVALENDDGYNEYGVIDENGKEIVPLMYQNVEILNNGLIVVMGDYERLGLYNKDGKELFDPYYYNLNYIGNFCEGMGIVHKENGTYDDSCVCRTIMNINMGFINEAGEDIIDTIYDVVRDFHEGRAAVMRGDFWGFIDKNGYEITDLAYDAVRDFEDEKAAVCINGKWGYIRDDGKVETWSIKK